MRSSSWLCPAVLIMMSCSPQSAEPAVREPIGRRAESALRLVAKARPAPAGIGALGRLDVILPSKLGRGLHLERSMQPGVSIEVRDLDVHEVDRLEVEGSSVFVDAAKSTDVVLVAESARVEELRVIHENPGTISVRQSVSLGPALHSVRAIEGFVEILDENGVARLRADRALAIDANGVRRVLDVTVTREADEFVITWMLDGAGLKAPIAVDPAWTATTSLAIARRSHMAAWLEGTKRAMIMGGGGIAEQQKTTELYDPATASWTMGASMGTERYYSAVAVLASGKVLVAGSGTFRTTAGPTTAEVYDPLTNSWTATGAFSGPVISGTADRLASGKVLVVAEASSQLYDPTTNAWSLTTGQPIDPRRVHASAVTTTATGKEKVLIDGGYSTVRAVYLQSAESFDSLTQTWTAAPDMKVPRSFHTSHRLSTRKVLVPGGFRGEGLVDPGNASAELWDPDTNTWTSAPDMHAKHSIASAAMITPGRVLIMGGDLDSELTDITEIYDDATNAWTLAGRMTDQREDFTATVLPPSTAGGPSRVLAAAGSNGGIIRTTELFEPILAGKPCVDAGECGSGACVEGTCCSTATCAAGETCANPFGKCLTVNGGACTGDGQCASALCVDGFCCNDSCGGQCQACDVAGKLGTCTTVAAGEAPHGGDRRPACNGTGACGGKCGGGDPFKCTAFPGSSVSCSPASCATGKQSIVAGCDGKGGCTSAVTTTCAPFACGDTACKTKCATKADCAEGYDCDDRGLCVVGAKCDGISVAVDATGGRHDCAPIVCSAGACLPRCQSSADCVGGFFCDDSGACMATTNTGDGSSSGCSYGRPTTTGAEILMGLLVAALVRVNRRRTSR